MLRVIRWSAIALIALLAGAWGVVWWTGQRIDVSQVATGVSVGGAFALTDAKTGSGVTDTSYRGKWMLVYFGYTFCPDVCPTELQAISASLDDLGPAAARVVPIFITVDPERDTPQVMADYVKLFDDRLVGLTGSEAQVAAAARAYRVYYAKVPEKQGPYLMDHSSFLYLMGPDGSLRKLLQPGLSGAEIATQIRAAIGTS